MPAALKALPQSGLSIPWGEGLDGANDPTDMSDASFSASGARVVQVFHFDGKEFDNTIPSQILGYPRRGNGKLVRKRPIAHGFWTWLYASEITSIRGMGFVGKSATFGYSQFQRYAVTVVFSSPTFDILPDAQVTNESQRWVEFACTPRCDMIGLRNQFKISDPTAGALNGNAILGDVGVRFSKLYQKFIWSSVPQNYVLDSNFYPVNCMAALGTVNSDDFRDAVPGTLLCDAIDLHATYAPCHPSLMGDLKSTSPRTFTVSINLLTWNPGQTH